MDLPERRQTASAVRRANGARARPRRSSLSPAPSASLLTGSSSPYSTHNGTCSTYTLTLVTAVTPPPQALPTPSPALVCTVRPAPLRPRHSRLPAQPWSAPSAQPLRPRHSRPPAQPWSAPSRPPSLCAPGTPDPQPSPGLHPPPSLRASTQTLRTVTCMCMCMSSYMCIVSTLSEAADCTVYIRRLISPTIVVAPRQSSSTAPCVCTE
jgi:hypothetical protein